MTEPQKEYIITEKEFVELANVHTEGISPARIFDIAVKVKSRPYTSAEQVLEELQKRINDVSDPMTEDEYDSGRQSAYREMHLWICELGA